MKHVSAFLLAAAAMLGAGCNKGRDAADGGEAGSSTAASSDPGPAASWLTQRDPSLRPPPPAPSAASNPLPRRPPDWDLDPDDPARDYVRRYTFYTRRYGDNLDCVVIGASQASGDKRSVEVKNAPACPGAGAQRDVFLVDLADDRLTVDDQSKRDPLARWPDGSSADGPAGEVIRETYDMKAWTSPLRDVFQRALLVPIRVQAYGRGTYPVVSIAGWHAKVQLDAPPEDLRSFAADLCKANGGMPLGILSAQDRTRILKIRCPAATAWDRL